MEREHTILGRPAIRQMMDYQEELMRKIKERKITIDEFIRLYNRATLGLTRDVDPIIRTMILLRRIDYIILEMLLPDIFNLAIRRALDYTQELLKKPTVKQVKQL